MAKKKKETQYDLLEEIIGKAEINIVTCGNCGTVILHRIEQTEISCPDCKFTSEPCDFPDFYHE